eukprot:COSAG02_NODE_1538_length_12042_cov_323.842083_14_plen_97_part_00
MNVVVATCALGAAVAVGERSMAEAAPVSAARSSGKLVADGSGNILADAKSAFAYARAHLMVSHDSQHHLVQGYSCACRNCWSLGSCARRSHLRSVV